MILLMPVPNEKLINYYVKNMITKYEGMNLDPKIGSKLQKNSKKIA